MSDFVLTNFEFDPDHFCATLRARRKELGLSMSQLADQAGVAPATVHKLESGGLTIHLDKFLKVVDVLGLALSDLVPPCGIRPTDPRVLQLGRLVEARAPMPEILRLLAELMDREDG
ncbi:MAG: helix-turn-helix transcriptional regulator [Sumerlaeia bacterium]